MRLNPIFKIKLENGKVTFLDLDIYKNYIKRLKNGYYEVVLRRPKKIRSLEQNAYFHGVAVQILSEELGIDFEDMKDLLKTQFLRKTILLRGKPFEIVQHSSELDTIDFNKFVKDIQRFAAGLNIIIPDPEKVDLKEYQNK